MASRTVHAIARSSSRYVMFLVTAYVLILGVMLTLGSA
jgi:hypothetical protein